MNLFSVNGKTILIKLRTRHRSTCQAFPCDNQCQAVDTTLSWSAWGMVHLLIMLCEIKKINYFLRKYMSWFLMSAESNVKFYM